MKTRNVVLLSALILSSGILLAQRGPQCRDVRGPHSRRDCDLTRREIRDLRRDEMELNQFIRHASADGRINRREARRIRQMDAALDRKMARYQCNPHKRRHC